MRRRVWPPGGPRTATRLACDSVRSAMETTPTTEPATPAPADIDHCSVVEVLLLLREPDMAELSARAARHRMTAGQLLRRLVALYLATGDDK